MTDTMTVVYFKGITRGFSVPSVLTDFSLFGIPLHVQWYGVIIAFGFLLAVLFGGRIAYKWKINLDKMLDVLIYGTIFGILGARLYYVIFQWENYAGNIASIFKIWEGGLAIYGGLIGGLLAAYVTCKVRKLNFRNLLDMSAMSFSSARVSAAGGTSPTRRRSARTPTCPGECGAKKPPNTSTRTRPSFSKEASPSKRAPT